MPDNVRTLRGNPGKRKPPARPQPVRGVPTMPTWLPTEARAEWKRITPELQRLGLLAHIDRAVLAAYCDAWAKFVALGKLVTPATAVVPDAGHGGVKKSPAWQMYRDSAALVVTLAKELGLSPNARGRMRAPEVQSHDPLGILDR